MAALSACSSEGATESITVAGSTTCLPIAEQAAELFKEEAGIGVLVSGLGSSAGIEAVSTGTAEIATSSRGLNAEESKLGLTTVPVAHDGIAVIVNTENPVHDLTIEQLRGIYSGQITNWSEVGGEDLTFSSSTAMRPPAPARRSNRSSWTAPLSTVAPPCSPARARCAMS